MTENVSFRKNAMNISKNIEMKYSYDIKLFYAYSALFVFNFRFEDFIQVGTFYVRVLNSL